MIELNEFLLKSSIVLLVFYVGYWFLLRKGTHFKLNRFYLLAGLVFSLILPFLSFQLPNNNTSEIFIILDSIDISANGQLVKPKIGFNLINFLQVFYFSIVFILLFRTLIQFYLLLKMFIQAETEVLGDTKIVITDKKNAVFSFFNFVFVNRESKNSVDFQAILKHEHVHIIQKHSVDILLAEVLFIFLWFNPFSWLYRKSIKENHEFLADEGVVNNGYSANHYQKVLFEQSTGLHLSLANNFNQSLTFKRLNMMKKIKSNKLVKYKVLIAVPVIVAMVIFVACSKELVNIEPAKEENSVDQELRKKTMAISDKDTVFFIVETMPQFPGKELGLRKYIAQNVKYPQEARVNGIEGKVYVRFAVLKDGSVGNVMIARGVDSLLDNEALRVVKTLPKWIPAEQDGKKVNVWYTVPINFALNQKLVVTDKKMKDMPVITESEYQDIVKNGNEIISVKSIPRKDVYEKIETRVPEYPGGSLGLRKFLAKNLNYPEEARKNGISGKVFIKFLITEEGMVDLISIIKGGHETINDEAIRVVKLTSGQWTPGEIKGEKVDVWYTVPVDFKLK